MKKIVALASLSALAAVAAAENAAASGFAIRENSSEAVGMAYAGEGALADDPSTVFNNPAGMSFLQGNWLEFGAAVAFPTVNYNNISAVDHAFGAPIQGNDSGDGARSALIPDLYGLYHINEQWTAGLAVTSPFGNMIKYNNDFFGRYSDTEFSALSVDINPNISYKVNERLSVAGGLSAQYATGTFGTAINQGVVCAVFAACSPASSDAELRFKGDSWGVGYNLGLLFKPWPDTNVGLTYRSKVEQKLTGDAAFQNLNPALAGAFASGPTTVDVAVPASTGLSVTHDLNEKLTLASEVQYTQWSVFNSTNLNIGTATGQLAVPQNYRDSWLVSVGAQYHLTSAWTLRGGVGWDQSPLTDVTRNVSLPDGDRYMLAVGFGYIFNDHWSADAAYTHYFATSASVNDRDLLGVDSVTGNYELSLDYLMASLKYKF